MKPDTLPLVRRSWDQLEPQRERLGALFYEGLFAQYPDLRAMFKGDLQAQGTKLMATLNLVVSLLDDLSPLWPTLRELGQRHRELQVLPAHYDAIARALDRMLVTALGADATDAVRQAWQEAYWMVARPMLQDGA